MAGAIGRFKKRGPGLKNAAAERREASAPDVGRAPRLKANGAEVGCASRRSASLDSRPARSRAEPKTYCRKDDDMASRKVSDEPVKVTWRTQRRSSALDWSYPARCRTSWKVGSIAGRAVCARARALLRDVALHGLGEGAKERSLCTPDPAPYSPRALYPPSP